MPSAERFGQAPVIAIDGPSGAGKGTVSLAVVDQLGYHYLESGAVYRVIAHLAQKNRVGVEQTAGLVDLARNLAIEFRSGAVRVDGVIVDDVIRTEEAGRRASLIAAVPAVRETLLLWQQNQARAPGLVADGRDMGTVVFPRAVCKFYITASVEVRAQRRFDQLKDKGFDVSIDQLIRDISERDARDATRPVSPLRPAADAVLVDTTGLAIHEVVSRVMESIRDRMPERR